jgi:hypothetical protein
MIYLNAVRCPNAFVLDKLTIYSLFKGDTTIIY